MRWAIISSVLLVAACAAPPPAITPAPEQAPVMEQAYAPGKPSVRAEIKAAPAGDILHGNYETWWPNGKRAAVGHYLNGRRDGQWRQWYENGNPECEARFENDQLIGTWRTWFSNGRLQEQGVYVDGQRSGCWELFAESGELVSRIDYRDGQPVHTEYGPALITRHFPNHDGYPLVRMTFRRGNNGAFSREGGYRAWHENGQVAVEGNYRQDRRFGAWREWHPNGKKALEATYDEEGQLQRHWSIWHPNGVLDEEGEYAGGKREGRWNRRTQQGVRVVSHYRQGVLHGPYFEFGPDDEVLVSGRYEEGAPVGDWMQASGRGMIIVPYGSGNVDERYESGRIKARGERVEGLREGQWTFYYENGQLALEASFEKGKLHHTARSLRSDGKRWREAAYFKGVRTGPAAEWDEDDLSYLRGEWDFEKSEGAWELCDWLGNHLKSYQRSGNKWRGAEAALANIAQHETRYENGAVETRWNGYELNGVRFMHGEFKRFYADGKLQVLGQYTNNVASGEWVYYCANEKPMARGNYREGDRAGNWLFYHENGELARRGRFGHDWEKPLELPVRKFVSFEPEIWEIELDWRGFEPSFPEKRESWIYYDKAGKVAERRYFEPRGR